MKNRVGVKYLDKRKYCVGSEPSALVYICILVTSTTTGHGGSVVRALASQALLHKQKVGGSTLSCSNSCFFPPSIFYLTFPTSYILYLSGLVSNSTDNWSDFVL